MQASSGLRIPSKSGGTPRGAVGGVMLVLLALLVGCAAHPTPRCDGHRPFELGRDTFSYPNELVWEYNYDDQGHWQGRPRSPPPTYTHRCFVVARSAKQFFLHARFEPDQARADADTYRQLIRRVVGSSPRRERPASRQIVIPGYSDLASFSRDWEALLKAECGSFWQSYFQRGHWRMLFPFSRGHQDTTARRLLNTLERGHVTVVHVVEFPSLRINHALLVVGVEPTCQGLDFRVYDPNDPTSRAPLSYDRTKRTFRLPANPYYPGGALDVYEVYCSTCY